MVKKQGGTLSIVTSASLTLALNEFVWTFHSFAIPYLS